MRGKHRLPQGMIIDVTLLEPIRFIILLIARESHRSDPLLGRCRCCRPASSGCDCRCDTSTPSPRGSPTCCWGQLKEIVVVQLAVGGRQGVVTEDDVDHVDVVVFFWRTAADEEAVGKVAHFFGAA